MSRLRVPLRAARRIALAVGLATIGADLTAAQSPAPPTLVEEIVVRARRRVERIERTPVAVTAISRQQLRGASTNRLEDVQDLVPNMVFQTNRNDDQAWITLRGVGALEGGEPGVGFYLDGVFLGAGSPSVLNVAHVDQVEVLRGPQGTLFGKNTIGGAIHVRSRPPAEVLGGFAELRAGRFGQIETRASIDVPVDLGPFEDRLFTRFSFATARIGGYTTNELRDERASDRDAFWLLARARWLPLDDIEMNLSVSFFEGHSTGRGARCTIEEGSVPAIGAVLAQEYPGFEDACRASSRFRFRADTDGISNPRELRLWGDVRWALPDRGPFQDTEARLIWSWADTEHRSREDLDMTGLPILDLSALGGTGILDGRALEDTRTTLEAQVTGTALDRRLTFVAGAFGQWTTGDGGFATRALPGTIADQLGGSTRERARVDNWDWALFGQATAEIREWIEVTAGLRYTEEKKGLDRLTENPLGDAFSPGETITILDDASRAVFSAWTPMASVSLHAPQELLGELPIDSLMTYASWARGFKGGGFNAGVSSTRQPREGQELQPFAPERMDSFEVGFKLVAFEGRARISAAAFHADYEDVQVITQRPVPGLSDDDIPTVERIVLNAAEATVEGLELEVQLEPADRLLVRGSLSLLDPFFDEYPGIDDATGAVRDRAGETFPNTSRVTAGASIAYTHPIAIGPDWMHGSLAARLDWAYRGRTHLRAGPELAQATQPGYHLLHLRTGWTLWNDDLEVNLFVRNLTDEAYFTDTISFANVLGYVLQYYEPPRTVGAELRIRF